MTNTNNKDLTSTNFGKDNENKFDTASNVNTFDKNNTLDADTTTKTTFDKDNNFNSYDKVNTYDKGVNEYPNNTYNRSLSANTLKEYEVKNTNYSTRDFALGFTVGISLGTLLGLLFAPKKDDKRDYDNVEYKGSYLKGNQEKEDNKPSAVDQLKDKAAEIKDKATDKVAEVKEKAQDTQNKAESKNNTNATGYNEATSHVTTKVETDADALAAQRRAIKDEVNDDSLKEPIAIVDKDLNTNKTTSKTNNTTKVNTDTKVNTTKTDFKSGNAANKNNKK